VPLVDQELYTLLWHLISPTVFSGVQRGTQNPYIEEEQTTQRPTEKVQNDNDLQNIHIKQKIEKHELHPFGILKLFFLWIYTISVM
jgi:hypothetical protein